MGSNQAKMVTLTRDTIDLIAMHYGVERSTVATEYARAMAKNDVRVFVLDESDCTKECCA